jgi:hypothetical protein
MKDPRTFGIRLTRLPRVADTPGLICLTVDETGANAPPRRMGNLTDVALRGRLAHYNLHSANEVAAIRQALREERGEATAFEQWTGLGSCVEFWSAFPGSHIRSIEWTCDGCGAANRETVGAATGESFLRLCKCGQTRRITVTSVLVPA